MINNASQSIKSQVIQLFESGDVTARKAFLAQCPPLRPSERGEILKSLEGTSAWGITALSVFAQEYAHTARYELGAILGEVCYQLAKNILETPEPTRKDDLFYGAQGALSCVISLKQMGDNKEALKIAEEAIPWLESWSDTTTLPSLKLHQIEANINLENIEEADILLNQINKKSLSKFDFKTFQRLKKTVEDKKKPVVKLPSSEKLEYEKVLNTLGYMLASIQPMLEYEPEARQDFNKLENLLKQIKKQKQLTYTDFELASRQAGNVFFEMMTGQSHLPTARAFIQQLIDVCEKLLQPQNSSSLTTEISQINETNQLNEWSVMRQLEVANSILLDSIKQNDLKQIERALVIYQHIQKWTKDNQDIDDENDALWGIYLCYSRLDRPVEAVEALQTLRNNIETIRPRIAAPYGEITLVNKYPAGILTVFPYLFPALCVQLYKLHRPMELLDAIEGAKGRVLADIRTKQKKQAVSEGSFSESVRQIPALMQQVKAHYLTYLMDEKETFAVLVAKDGSLHTQKIEIGKTHLQDWLNYKDTNYNPLNPAHWGKTINPRKKLKVISDLPERLATFVSWLEPLVKSGLLEQNDHLCYCPDEYLHLIPLHYLPFQGEPLVRFLSVSRIQSAVLLNEILNHPNVRPTQYTSIDVSAQSDRGLPNTEQKLHAFQAVKGWLKRKMTLGDVISEEKADLKTVMQLPFERRLVHFATHGIFLNKTQDIKKNPYSKSSLVLAKDGHLPGDLNGGDATLFTPQRVIEGNLNFSGSHVSLSACVSGLAKEGIGGDALGLEWAFLLAGANSVLATHWNADAGRIANFSFTFYQRWLLEGNSRALAWQKTVLELMAHPDTSHPYYWAAFSLSGDWR